MSNLRMFMAVFAGSASLAVGGCALAPTAASGPTTASVLTGISGEPGALPYSLVHVTPEKLEILAHSRPRFARTFPSRSGPTNIRFGIGDVVSVTIFEASAGGLFIPIEAGVRPGNFITLPNQNVDNGGNISVPYAGAIPARGRTPTEVQQSIIDALRNARLSRKRLSLWWSSARR